MSALFRPLQRCWTRHRCAAGRWRDALELLSATALCALLEGWWQLRYSDAMTVSAARLTLALLPIAPLALAAAAGSYMKAHAARTRGRRADIALYRVLGGDMRRAAGRQALAAALRVLLTMASGMIIARLLLPPLPIADALPTLSLTTLAALGASLALAVDAAWRTWSVPAAYDLAASEPAADASTEMRGDLFDDLSNDHAGGAIEQRLRALYAASPLLARRKRRPAIGRHRHALNPLLLAIYVLLAGKHHPSPSHGDAGLAQNNQHNDSNAHHRDHGLQDAAGDDASMGHVHRLADAATPPSRPEANAASSHASGSLATLEISTVPLPTADRGTPPAAPSVASLADSLGVAALPHAAAPQLAIASAPGGADAGMNGYHAGMEAMQHNPPPIKSISASSMLTLSVANVAAIEPGGSLLQHSITQITSSSLLVTSVASGSAADLTQAPGNGGNFTVQAIPAIDVVTVIGIQSPVTLSQNSIGSPLAAIEATLPAGQPVDTGTAHTGAELSSSSGIVIVGQPLDGHPSSLHLG